jgi:hypothetical protein
MLFQLNLSAPSRFFSTTAQLLQNARPSDRSCFAARVQTLVVPMREETALIVLLREQLCFFIFVLLLRQLVE